MPAEGGAVPFAEAIDFLRSKVNLPTQKWDDLVRDAHVRGYTVAGVTRDDMLAEFREATEKARLEGTGLAEFRKTFDAVVERTGWQFRARGDTEEERRAWRARIIYTTNMRTSYMAGRYAQMTDPDVVKYRPWWQYKHSGAAHPRQAHLALDEKVFRWDDPVWRVYFPPNGFGCGCDVAALSDRQLRALGKTGADDWPLGEPYPGKDPRTGEPEIRYPGIDRGWEYNVGRSWTNGLVPRELATPLPPAGAAPAAREPLPPMPPARPAPATRLLGDDMSDREYVDAFLGAFGLRAGGAAFHRDPSGGIVTVSAAMFEQRDREGNVVGLKAGKRDRGRFALLLADTIVDPDEIWVDWASMASGIVLRRAYLRRVVLDDGRQLLVRFEWTSRGWTAITGFDTTENYLSGLRRGALLFRRQE